MKRQTQHRPLLQHVVLQVKVAAERLSMNCLNLRVSHHLLLEPSPTDISPIVQRGAATASLNAE